MLALGRAMMAKPRVLLLDEPSLGLAPRVVRRIFDSLRTLNESGTTIVLVEQNATSRSPLRSTRTCSKRVMRCWPASRTPCSRTSRSGAATSVTRWRSFLQHVVSGLASGGIYGLLALGIVLIHRATGG